MSDDGSEAQRGPADIEREVALDYVSEALRRCAANILRVCRGAGEPYRIGRDCSAVVDKLVAYRDIAGVWPTSDQLSRMLRRERQDLSRFSAGEQIRADAIEAMVRGALQITASDLVDQRVHSNRGETELLGGVRELHAHWANRDRKATPSRKPRAPNDV